MVGSTSLNVVQLVKYIFLVGMPIYSLKTLLLQEGVAVEIAEAVVGALAGELSATAVNAPMVPAEVNFWNTSA